MTHEQEEKAEAPFFKTGKHPTKREMAKKMTNKALGDGFLKSKLAKGIPQERKDYYKKHWSPTESKTYTHIRCGKCNRFGHHHDQCTTKQKYPKYIGGEGDDDMVISRKFM
jgi:hypothetical protein